jgi:hypothetical protein
MKRTLIIAFFTLATLGSCPASQALQARSSFAASSTISPQSLKYVLDQCLLVWPEYSYGDLRSAYNHGTLTIVSTVKPDGVYNDVSFGGITLCVIETI